METWTHPLEQAPKDGPTVLTLGNFDGVHRGHQQLLQAVVDEARRQDVRSAVVTFDPHPTVLLSPHGRPRQLITLAQKRAAFEQAGVELAWVLPFSRAFSEQEPATFLDALGQALRPRSLHVGEAFRFGKHRQGDLAHLQAWGARHGCAVQGHRFKAPDGGALSSSRVRRALEAGAVEEALQLLGHPFVLTGVVEEGDRRGRHLGFPTANLAWEQEQLPACGVYVTEVRAPRLDAPRLGLTNVGEKPTFQGLRLTVETHLPDFQGDLYGTRLELAFLHRLRDERRFPDLEAHMAQIATDVAAGRAWWEQAHP